MSILRVGIDGRAFTSPAAGVRRYVTGLTAALSELRGSLDLVALGGDASAVSSHGLSHVPEPPHPPTNLGWVTIGLPWAAARAAVDLIHAPAYTAPFHSRSPVVLTIHDVSYARHPEWYPYHRDGIRRAFYAWSARAATHVLTDSEFSANEITAAYGIPRGRITVAPLGVDREQFSPAPLGGVLSPDPKVGARPYVLHVGDLHARRNVIVVLRALLELFREDATQTPVLVLAGVEQGAGSALAAMAASVGASDFVVQLGTVDEARLVGLYHSALAVVYPSKYEGFGLPLAEAMSCGVPVVASCEASIPEVVGKAGLLLDPDDVVVWADAIRRLTRDPSLRARMGAAGMVRAASLTWERTAHITFSAYGRAVSGAQE